MSRNVGGGELFAQVSGGYVTDPGRSFLEIGIFLVDQRGECNRPRATELTETLKGHEEAASWVGDIAAGDLRE